jgi:TetR/AcrR family transcriptional regulator, cholesterol catabolism regulator
MDENTRSIVEKVSRLYQRYGIKSVTMDDVAKHLGISKKTLYEYFSDKEDLVRQVVYHSHDKMEALFSGIRQNLNPIEELLEVYRLIRFMFRDYNPSMEYDIRKYYPDLYNRIKETRRNRMFETVYRNLAKGKSEGLYRREMNSRIIAKLHVLRVEGMFENELFTVEEITSLKVFHEIFYYHVFGILSPKGVKYFSAISKKVRDVFNG